MDNVFRRYWTPEEKRRLLAQPRALSGVIPRRDAAWLQLLISSGFRIQEFSRLNVEDATEALAAGWVFLPREIRKGGRVDHQVPVTKPIAQALRELLAVQRLMGGTGEASEPLVLSRNGQRMSVRGYQFKVAEWCAAAGIEGSPHFARHTRAMDIKRQSTSNDWRGIVRGMLGHASLESSVIYAGVSKEDLQREMEQIDGAEIVRKQDLRKRFEQRRSA